MRVKDEIITSWKKKPGAADALDRVDPLNRVLYYRFENDDESIHSKYDSKQNPVCL